MDVIINKIKKIQNKQQSLRWGHYKMSDDETMFAVGNKAYPREPHFFTVTSDHIVYLLDDSHKRSIYGEYSDIYGVAAGVIALLKEWLPAK